MKFDLVRPCANCPFRHDILGYLRAERVEEITDALLGDATFSCHKTNSFDEEGVIETADSQHCAGALIFLEFQEMPNQMMRIGERVGFYAPSKLDMDSPVFDDAEAMAAHHGGRERTWATSQM